MSVDVDAVNERLNGLVTLLQAVGVDSGDVAGISNGMSGSKSGGVPDARQLDDSQIEAIIRKLQQAQAEAPQIIAALEAHAEARSLNGSSSHKRQPEPVQQAPPEPQIEEDEDESEEDEDEGNYPMVGHGISDDISVVSDLTTPTVLTGVAVPEEEHYRDTLPPMIVGGGPGNAPPMLINPTKRKNLVSQVRGIAPPTRRNAPAPNRGGAAASRRKNYNHVVSRLAQEAPVEKPRRTSATSSRSSGGRSLEGKKLKKKKIPRPAPGAPQRPQGPPPPQQQLQRPSPPPQQQQQLHQQQQRPGPPPHQRPPAVQEAGWNAFETTPPPQKKESKRKPAATVIDNDGFLVGDAFDAFETAAPVPAPVAQGFSSSAGELAYQHQQLHHHPQQPRPDQPRRPRPKKLAPPPAQGAPQPLRKPQGAASAGRPRRARRASLV